MNLKQHKYPIANIARVKENLETWPINGFNSENIVKRKKLGLKIKLLKSSITEIKASTKNTIRNLGKDLKKVFNENCEILVFSKSKS